jgi:hypothetical protein
VLKCQSLGKEEEEEEEEEEEQEVEGKRARIVVRNTNVKDRETPPRLAFCVLLLVKVAEGPGTQLSKKNGRMNSS